MAKRPGTPLSNGSIVVGVLGPYFFWAKLRFLIGHLCTGVFQRCTSVFVLNFHLKTKVVAITYRVVDKNSTRVLCFCQK